MRVFYNNNSEMTRFAIEDVREAARARNIALLLGGLWEAPMIPCKGDLVVKNSEDVERHRTADGLNAEAEHYSLVRSPMGGFTLTARGEAGTMFGLMDVADMLLSGDEDALHERNFRPPIGLRGVKPILMPAYRNFLFGLQG